MKREKQIGIIYAVGLVILAIVMVYLTITQGPKIHDLVADPQIFKQYLGAHGHLDILIFIALQILQVVIAAIPGEFIQLAGGYVFGTFLGTLYSVLGILLGSIIAFFIARLIGYPAIKLLVPLKSYKKFEFLLTNSKVEIVIFIIFLIPGIPKDVLTYMAGLTPLNPLRFLIGSTIARIPSNFMASYIGANIQTKHTMEVVIALSVAAVLCIIGIFYRDRIMDWANRYSSVR
ncbi:MAG: TVP38/TMEM64 family protein [Methylocystaceae bacterium]